MDLIAQLKQEHVEIMRSFSYIKDKISGENPGDKDLIETLRELEDTLVAHLELEDKMLYPPLSNSGNEEAKELGKKFSEEMTGISKVAMAFFKGYMGKTISDLLGSSEFRKELDGIINTVTKRVETEEKILYPAYKKYIK